MEIADLKEQIFESGLVEFFSIIQDPRTNGRHQLHKLVDILVIALCATICGAEHWTEMEDYGHQKEDWLRIFLELPNGIPSHDTFQRVFGLIEPIELKKAFDTWVNRYLQDNKDCIISIDGKTSRGSQDRINGKKPIHLLNVWLHDAGLVLGQLKVDDKTNEITAIPKMLEGINVKGHTITIDAMGCQKNIAETIISKKGDYVLALKGNQGTLQSDIEEFMLEETKKTSSKMDPSKWDYFETTEKGHGRIEQRRYWHTTDVEWLKELGHDWAGLRSVCLVKSSRKINSKKTTENRLYISSYQNPNAERIGKTVRAHWGIENQLHYVLDVSMGEDASRVRKDNGPENFSLLRKISLNYLKQHQSQITQKKKPSLRSKRKMAGWDDDYLAEILFGIKFINLAK